MEDCTEDSLYGCAQFGICLACGSCHSLAFPLQDLSLPARTRPKHRESGSIHPHRTCLTSLLQDLHGDHQKHHDLRKPQDCLRVLRLAHLQGFSHYFHHQLLLHLHLCLLLRLPCLQLHLRDKDPYYTQKVNPILFRI